MMLDRIYKSENLSQDLMIIVLGLAFCFPLFLYPRLYESEAAYVLPYWVIIVGKVLQGIFIIFALLILTRLRYPQSAIAGVFLVGSFYLRDYLPTVPLVLYLNQIFLGPGFWALVIIGPLWVWQMLNSRLYNY